MHTPDFRTVIEYTGVVTNYNQISDFVDLNELPLVIDYSDKTVASRRAFDR